MPPEFQELLKAGGALGSAIWAVIYLAKHISKVNAERIGSYKQVVAEKSEELKKIRGEKDALYERLIEAAHGEDDP